VSTHVFKGKSTLTFALNLSKWMDEHPHKTDVLIGAVFLLLGAALGYYAGIASQQQTIQQLQQQSGKLNSIDCLEAQLMANSVNANSTETGAHATVTSNPDGSCNLQYSQNLSVNLHLSECISVEVRNANGSVVTQENGCATTSASSTTSTR